jgi:hypothetical protein
MSRRIFAAALDGAAFIVMVAALVAAWIVLDSPDAYAAAPADCAASPAGVVGVALVSLVIGGVISALMLGLVVMSRAAAATREHEDYETPISGREGGR